MSSSIVDVLGRIPLSGNLMSTLTRAAGYAGAQQHREVALEHLLLALTEDPDAALVLTISRVEIETLKGDISTHIGRMDDRVTQSPVADLRIASELKDILQAAAAAAEGRRNEIDGAIVLAAIVGDGRSASAHLLRAHGLTFETAIRALQQAATVGQPPNPAPGAPQPQSGAPQSQSGAPPQPAPQPAAEAPAQARAATQRPVAHHNPTNAEDILASARQRVQGRIAPGLPDSRAIETAETERADTLAAAEAATGAEFERIAAEASHTGEPATVSHEAALDAEMASNEPESHAEEPRPAPPAQRPMPPGALRPAGPPRPSPQPHGASTGAPPHAGQQPEPRRTPQPVVAPFPSIDTAGVMPPPQNATQPGRTTQPAPDTTNRFERANATPPLPGQPHTPAPMTGPHAQPAATADERTGGRGSDRFSDHAPGHAASAKPSMAPPMPSPGSTYAPVPPAPHAPHGASTAGSAPAGGYPGGTRPAPAPMRGPMPPGPATSPVTGQPPAGAGGQRMPPSPVPQAGPSPAQRPGPPPMPPGYRPPDAHPGTFAGQQQPAPPRQGRAPGTPPPPARPPPEPQRRAAPPPGGQGAHGAPVSVSIGQLVENIPRVMRVAVASLVEVRIARADVKAVSDGMQGGGPAHRHEVKVTKAMSVRLRAPDGGFFIESSSPETQWIDNAHMLSDDFASWRWTVTPKERGSRRLQLVISARTVASDGLAAETSLPDQIVEVRVKSNYAKAMVRTGGWAVAAIAGGLLAKFGEGLPQVAWELTKVFVKQ